MTDPRQELNGRFLPSTRAAVCQMLNEQYGIQADELRRLLRDEDCHDYFGVIGRLAPDDPLFVIRDAAKVYSSAVAVSTIRRLIDLLREDAARQ